MTIWTIGHSTRMFEELVEALAAHHIQLLSDVRSFPTSARHPQFNREELELALPRAGIGYRWLGKNLGGYRKRTRADSPHRALRSPGFRNYADHMESEAFRLGIEELLQLAGKQRVACMCAERLWWRCHRMLISDYLIGVRGKEVVHILDAKKAEPHRMSRAAQVVDGRLVYDVGDSPKLFQVRGRA